MAKFLVSGEAKYKSEIRPFEKLVEAENEKLAKEKALSLLGSNSKVKRVSIKIFSVEKIE
jgi:ribosomal protein L20A (L18A)